MSNNLFLKVKRVCELLGSMVFCDDLRFIDVDVNVLRGPSDYDSRGWTYVLITLSYGDIEVYGIAACPPRFTHYLIECKTVATLLSISDCLPVMFFQGMICAKRFCSQYSTNHSDFFFMNKKLEIPALRFENALKMMSRSKMIMYR